MHIFHLEGAHISRKTLLELYYLTFFTAFANAALMLVDWKTVGDGLLTRNSTTGLDRDVSVGSGTRRQVWG